MLKEIYNSLIISVIKTSKRWFTHREHLQEGYSVFF